MTVKLDDFLNELTPADRKAIRHKTIRLLAQEIIDYAARNKIRIMSGIAHNYDRMCAAWVLCHMFIGDRCNDGHFSIWSDYSFDPTKDQIPYNRRQVRALEVGFEHYVHAYQDHNKDDRPEEYRMMVVGGLIRRMVKRSK